MSNLSPHCAHLYLASPEEWAGGDRLDRALALLSAEERERYERFRYPEPARSFLTGRALLRELLAHHGGAQATDWQLDADEHGRPRIVAPEPARPLEFNLTHNDRLVACVVTAGHACGVDVEAFDRSVEAMRVARHSFADEEVADLGRLEGEPLCKRFFAYWTLKEAYVKARGRGIAMRLDSVVFRFASDTPTDRIEASFAERTGDDSADWRFALYRLPGRQYLATALRHRNGSRLATRLFQARPGNLHAEETICEPVATSPASQT